MSPSPDQHDPVEMSFGDHLEELRRRIILAIAAPLPLMIVIFFFSADLIEWLLRPLMRVLAAHNLPQQVQALSPPETLLTQLKLSIIFALVAASPWIIWQAWRFIGPGLYQHERRFVYFLIPGSAILTTAGVSLLYFAMLPLMLHVLVAFGGTLRAELPAETMIAGPLDETAIVSRIDTVDEHPMEPMPGQMWLKMPERVLHIAVAGRADGHLEVLQLPLRPPSLIAQHFRLSEYISFVLMLIVGIAIAFQMPLVIVLLGWLGIVTVAWLRSQRRYALLICAVISAVITPAEVISMIIMLIPLYGLYELGILLLMLAPASAVARGRFTWRGRADKGDAKSENAAHPSQPESTIARGEPLEEEADESDNRPSDEKGGGS